MAKARYLVEAHLLEGRSVSGPAAAHEVHRSWIYKLLARYREGGYEEDREGDASHQFIIVTQSRSCRSSC